MADSDDGGTGGNDATPRFDLKEDRASSVSHGFLYCIAESSDDGPEGRCFKIGRSMNVEGRLSALQTGNPRRIKIKLLVGVEQGLSEIEARVMASIIEMGLAERARGEWFRLPSGMTSLRAIYAVMMDCMRHAAPPAAGAGAGAGAGASARGKRPRAY